MKHADAVNKIRESRFQWRREDVALNQVNVILIFHCRARPHQRVAQVESDYGFRVFTDYGQILSHATSDIENRLAVELRQVDLLHIGVSWVESEDVIY